MTRNPLEPRRAPQAGITPADNSDIPRLLSAIVSLRKEMNRARLRAANLEAATLAALHSAETGDIDPLEFLRDELNAIDGGRYHA